jgi:pyruvate,water dikinase
VVGGEVNPDNFLVDKVLYEIVRRTISPKAKQYRVADNGGVELVDVQPECRDQPSLTDSEVRAVAKMARAAERHYGAPQDVEWAIDCNATRGDGVVLLQSRPETVWSRRRREPIARGSGIESIVTTLLSPLNARKSKGKEEGKSEK